MKTNEIFNAARLANIDKMLSKKQIKLYNAILDEIFFDIENSKGIQRKGIILKILTALKQTCNHPAQFLDIKKPINMGFNF